MVLPADNTLAYIVKKVRRLTASASESALTTDSIYDYINRYYSNDFPASVKSDVLRNVYTFFTEPYRDRYPLDINYNQGVRSPVYVDGVQASFFKDREQFFNMWPRWPSKFTPVDGDGLTTTFTFNIPGPFLSNQVTLGGVDSSGNPITVSDDGSGNLQYQVPNPVVTVPLQTDVYTVANAPTPLVGKPIPGMHNKNTLNPGLNRTDTTTTPFTLSIGTVNYVTGDFSINFPVAPASGTQITVFVSQYQPGKPFSLLFWNNQFTIRPIPKLTHKVEVETYLTPVQFMETTDSPLLNQWSEIIALGAAIKVLEDRQDMDGVESLAKLYDRQESLVLERQGTEEIGMRNSTIYQGNEVGGGNWGNNTVGWY